MKNLRFIVLLAAASAAAQVSISANHITDAFERPTAYAQLCFVPVDASVTPSGFRSGALQILPNEVCGTVTAGVLQTGLSLAPSAPGWYYHVYVKQPFSTKVLRDMGVTSITGSSFSLDTYDPSVPAPASLLLGAITLAPSGSGGACSLSPGSGVSLLNCSIPQGPVGPPGPPFNSRGAYSPSATYAAGDWVYFTNSSSYVSLTSANTGHQPDASPGSWALFAGLAPTLATQIGQAASYVATVPTSATTPGGTVGTVGTVDSYTTAGVAIAVPTPLPVGPLTSVSISYPANATGSAATSDVATTTGVSVALATPLSAGPLGQLSLNFPTAGAGVVNILVLNGSGGSYSVAQSFTISKTFTAGLNTFVSGTDYTPVTTTAGQLIAYTAVSGNAPGLRNGSGALVYSGTPGSTPATWSTSGIYSAAISASVAVQPSPVTILILNASGLSLSVADSFVVTPTATSGTQTFLAGTGFTARNVAAGQLIGYYATGTTPGYLSTGSGGFYYHSGAVSSTPATWSVSGNQTISLSATVGPVGFRYPNTSAFFPSGTGHSLGLVPDPGATPSAAKFLREDGGFHSLEVNAARTLLASYSFASGVPSGWTVVGGAWGSSGGGMTSPTTVGYGNYVYAPERFSVERRTERVTFELLATGTQMGVGSYSDAGDPMGSLVVFDAVNGVLSIGNTYTAGTNPGTAASSALTFTPALNTPYTLVITNDRRVMTASISDPVSGTTTTVSSGNNVTSTGYYQSDGASAGTMFDHPLFNALAGQFLVLADNILADSRNPWVMFAGDSITQGYKLPLVQRWSQTAAQKMGKAVISGRTGATSATLLPKITNEVALIAPQNLVVLIGSNDLYAPGGNSDAGLASLKANYTAMLAQLNSLGIKVYACTVPPGAQRPQGNITAFNTWLLAQTGIAGWIRMDRALTTGRDGVTQNVSLYTPSDSTGVHPNQAGAIAMWNEVLIDAPQLFDQQTNENSLTVNSLQFVDSSGYVYSLTLSSGSPVWTRIN